MQAILFLFILVVLAAFFIGAVVGVGWMLFGATRAVGSAAGEATSRLRRFVIGESLAWDAQPGTIPEEWVTIVERQTQLQIGESTARTSLVRLRTHVGLVEPALRAVGWLEEKGQARDALPRMLHVDRARHSVPQNGPIGRTILQGMVEHGLLVAETYLGVIDRAGPATSLPFVSLLSDALHVEGRSDEQIRDWLLEEWFSGDAWRVERAANLLFEHCRKDPKVSPYFVEMLANLPRERAFQFLIERGPQDLEHMCQFIERSDVLPEQRLTLARHALKFSDTGDTLRIAGALIVRDTDAVTLAITSIRDIGIDAVQVYWLGIHEGLPMSRAQLLVAALAHMTRLEETGDDATQHLAHEAKGAFMAAARLFIADKAVQVATRHRLAELVEPFLSYGDKLELAREFLERESKLQWLGITWLQTGGLSELELLVSQVPTLKGRERDLLVERIIDFADSLHEADAHLASSIEGELARLLDWVTVRYDELLARRLLTVTNKLGPTLPRRILRDIIDVREDDTPAWIVGWFAEVGEYEDVARLHAIVEAGGDAAEDATNAMRVIQSGLGGDVGAMAVVEEQAGSMAVVEEEN